MKCGACSPEAANWPDWNIKHFELILLKKSLIFGAVLQAGCLITHGTGGLPALLSCNWLAWLEFGHFTRVLGDSGAGEVVLDAARSS